MFLLNLVVVVGYIIISYHVQQRLSATTVFGIASIFTNINIPVPTSNSDKNLITIYESLVSKLVFTYVSSKFPTVGVIVYAVWYYIL